MWQHLAVVEAHVLRKNGSDVQELVRCIVNGAWECPVLYALGSSGRGLKGLGRADTDVRDTFLRAERRTARQ